MNRARPQRSSRLAPPRELASLRARLAESEATLRAIRSGEVDAVVVRGRRGARVFTLEGVEHAYRVLIESMNEGALTLTADKTILYANQRFAVMVKCPLQQLMGSSFRRFLSAEHGATLRGLLKDFSASGSKIQVQLNVCDGTRMPAQISIRPLPRNGLNRAAFGMVVTDLTEARRTEELLRALTHRLVQAQESERRRVARELHDHITQLLFAILVRFQVLAEKGLARDGPSKGEAMRLHEMIGETAEEVERIGRNLRPSVLDQLGLVAVLRTASREFAVRTSLSLKLACAPLTARLPGDTELTLYRILQEALHNVEKHARARHVIVCLKRQGAFVQLMIKDDGIGFDPDRRPAGGRKTEGLGLLGMRERVSSVGGSLKVRSSRRTGTEINVRVPVGG